MGVAISDFYVCGVVAALHSSRMLHYCVQTVQGSSKIVSRSLQGLRERGGRGEKGERRKKVKERERVL